MSLVSRLLHTVRSWRLGRKTAKPSRRADVGMEHLDHRQLLAVNFTGNVATDFPATEQPGVVVLPDNANVQHPSTTYPGLAALVPVSGFDVNGIRVSYDSTTDVLSIGLSQPNSGQPNQPGPVIAGDADDNGDDGTVNPAVTTLTNGQFLDFPDFGGSEYMGAFLDLTGTNQPTVVAGYSVNDPRSPKQYQVAQANVNSISDFGTELPAFEGNVYKVNSPAHPNLEFSIAHFSQLYTQETGKTLTAGTNIGVGAFAGSASDLFNEAFFPEATVNVGQATVPVPPTPPPASPPVIINYHENKHVNTAHDTLVRAYVLGSSGFNVTQIIPSTVTLGGAHPISVIDRFVNDDEWPDATFIFRGTDINLPPGFTEATLAGSLTNGTTFSSSVQVFNRNGSFYTPTQLAGVQRREAARAALRNGFTILPGTAAGTTAASVPAGPLGANAAVEAALANAAATPAASAEASAAASASPVAAPVPVALNTNGQGATVSILGEPAGTSRLSARMERSIANLARKSEITAARDGATGTPVATARVPRALRTSLNRFARDSAAGLSTATASTGGR